MFICGSLHLLLISFLNKTLNKILAERSQTNTADFVLVLVEQVQSFTQVHVAFKMSFLNSLIKLQTFFSIPSISQAFNTRNIKLCQRIFYIYRACSMGYGDFTNSFSNAEQDLILGRATLQ